MFTPFGELLFGNVRHFKETKDFFIFEVAGINRSYDDSGPDDSPRYSIILEDSSWLVLNKELLSVKRGEDGKHVQFRIGFRVIFEKKKDGCYYYNFDKEVLVNKEPIFSEEYMIADEECIIRLSDGSIYSPKDYYSRCFGHCFRNLFYEYYEDPNDGNVFMRLFSLHATNDMKSYYRMARVKEKVVAKENILEKNNYGELLPKYFAFTKPVGEMMFGFRWNNGYNDTAVDLIYYRRIKTVIASLSYEDLKRNVRKGLFRINPEHADKDTIVYTVLQPDIFDKEYTSEFGKTSNNRAGFSHDYSITQNRYWIPEDFFLTSSEVGNCY